MKKYVQIAIIFNLVLQYISAAYVKVDSQSQTGRRYTIAMSESDPNFAEESLHRHFSSLYNIDKNHSERNMEKVIKIIHLKQGTTLNPIQNVQEEDKETIFFKRTRGSGRAQRRIAAKAVRVDAAKAKLETLKKNPKIAISMEKNKAISQIRSEGANAKQNLASKSTPSAPAANKGGMGSKTKAGLMVAGGAAAGAVAVKAIGGSGGGNGDPNAAPAAK